MKLLAPKDIAGQYCCDYGRGIECRHLREVDQEKFPCYLACGLYGKTVLPASRMAVLGNGGLPRKCDQCTDALAELEDR